VTGLALSTRRALKEMTTVCSGRAVADGIRRRANGDPSMYLKPPQPTSPEETLRLLCWISHAGPFGTMEPKGDVRGLTSTSGVPAGACWSLKSPGHGPEVAHDDSIGA